MLSFHSARVNIGHTIKLRLVNAEGNEVLVVELGLSAPKSSKGITKEKADDHLTIEWRDYATLTITHAEQPQYPGHHRYDFSWEASKTAKVTLQDEFNLSSDHWYGGIQIEKQVWPMEKVKRKLEPFVSGDLKDNDYGGVLERYWLSSRGAGLYVDPEVPLFIAINDGDNNLSLVSKYEAPYKNVDNSATFLRYTIFQGPDLKSTHQQLTSAFIKRPTDIPNEDMFRFPIWSTWVRYRKKINQSLILGFADEIRQKGFRGCQLEIDDEWTKNYGDMEFDKPTFNDPKTMVDELEKRGLRTNLWVHPFANLKSQASGVNIKYWVGGALKGVTNWWNGVARYLDVTYPAAQMWFRDSLKELQGKYGVTSFKFEAGQTNWLPKSHETHEPMTNPNTYATRYVELALSVDPDVRASNVRVGWQTQHVPLFVRICDKESNWTEDNGIKTLIPDLLTFSLIGYPFLLPDAIGGHPKKEGGLADRELYIRWLEVCTLFPALHFSMPPWMYDDETVRIAHKMVKLHLDYSTKILELAKQCVETGEPIIRPVWWIAPTDEIAHKIGDQFLVGNDLLVAPILEQGATKRQVYLPAGKWRDQVSKQVVLGGAWHESHAKLDELLHFTLEGEELED